MVAGVTCFQPAVAQGVYSQAPVLMPDMMRLFRGPDLCPVLRRHVRQWHRLRPGLGHRGCRCGCWRPGPPPRAPLSGLPGGSAFWRSAVGGGRAAHQRLPGAASLFADTLSGSLAAFYWVFFLVSLVVALPSGDLLSVGGGQHINGSQVRLPVLACVSPEPGSLA